MFKEYAILAVSTIEIVPAYEFSRLLSLVNDVYDTFLWIEELKNPAENSEKLVPLKLEEKLYIKYADIGRLDITAFFGIADHLVATAKFLGENYNNLLSIRSASVIQVARVISAVEYLKKASYPYSEEGKTDTPEVVELKNIADLENELDALKDLNTQDNESVNDKTEFMIYVKGIRDLSENIIKNATITLLKPS